MCNEWVIVPQAQLHVICFALLFFIKEFSNKVTSPINISEAWLLVIFEFLIVVNISPTIIQVLSPELSLDISLLLFIWEFIIVIFPIRDSGPYIEYMAPPSYFA